jgi:hypothetical protein
MSGATGAPSIPRAGLTRLELPALACKKPFKVDIREIKNQDDPQREPMKKSRERKSQVVATLKEADSGMKVADVC